MDPIWTIILFFGHFLGILSRNHAKKKKFILKYKQFHIIFCFIKYNKPRNQNTFKTKQGSWWSTLKTKQNEKEKHFNECFDAKESKPKLLFIFIYSLCEKENNFEGSHNCVAPKRIKRVFQGVNVKEGRRKNNVWKQQQKCLISCEWYETWSV